MYRTNHLKQSSILAGNYDKLVVHIGVGGVVAQPNSLSSLVKLIDCVIIGIKIKRSGYSN